MNRYGYSFDADSVQVEQGGAGQARTWQWGYSILYTVLSLLEAPGVKAGVKGASISHKKCMQVSVSCVLAMAQCASIRQISVLFLQDLRFPDQQTSTAVLHKKGDVLNLIQKGTPWSGNSNEQPILRQKATKIENVTLDLESRYRRLMESMWAQL